MIVTFALQVCKCRTCEPEHLLRWSIVHSTVAADVQSRQQKGSRDGSLHSQLQHFKG